LSDWKDFFHNLFMKYARGTWKIRWQKTVEKANGKIYTSKTCPPGYGKEWERKMVENTGERFKVR